MYKSHIKESKKNSNTTLVKVKFDYIYCYIWSRWYSNTTLVKVKSPPNFTPIEFSTIQIQHLLKLNILKEIEKLQRIN